MMLRRVLVIAGLMLSAVGVFAIPAGADKLIVNGTSVDASKTDTGFTAKISLFNARAKEVPLPETIKLTKDCDAEVDKAKVAGLSSESVTLTFGKSCFGKLDSLKADFDGKAGPMPEVTIKKPKDDSDWGPMGVSAFFSLLAALGVAIAGTKMVKKINVANQAVDPKKAAERAQDFAQLKSHVNDRVSDLQLPALTWEAALPTPEAYGLGSEVLGLEAGWSFKDSWAANLTVATTAFVALISSADTLTAVLGEKPEAALGVMTVAGLISAAVIAVANTIAKLVGNTKAEVTVLGLILSTSGVVFAAGLQTGTVGGGALKLVEGGLATLLVVVLTTALCIVLLAYAGISLYRTLKAGAPKSPLPKVPEDAFDAWAAEDDWEKEVVMDRIKTTYADWLVAPTPTLAVPYPTTPSGTLVTSRGDDTRHSRHSSLI